MGDRIEWIDIAKGIGIILVILGHTFEISRISAIYVFHMPLFFFLSGLVFRNTDSRFYIYVKTQSEKILKPWLKLYLISLVITITIPQWRGGAGLCEFIKEIYTSETSTVHNSSLWYLHCFFFVTIIFYGINMIRRTNLMMMYYWIVAIALLIILPKMPIRMPFKIDTAMIAVVFFSMAVWYKDSILKIMEKRVPFIIIVIFVITTLLLCDNSGWCNISSLSFGNYFVIYYLLAFMGICAVCLTSRWISDSGMITIRKLLSYYGKNSLIVFGFQGLLIRLYLLLFNIIDGLEMTYCGNNPIRHQIGAFFIITFIMSPLVVEGLTKLRGLGYKIH